MKHRLRNLFFYQVKNVLYSVFIYLKGMKNKVHIFKQRDKTKYKYLGITESVGTNNAKSDLKSKDCTSQQIMKRTLDVNYMTSSKFQQPKQPKGHTTGFLYPNKSQFHVGKKEIPHKRKLTEHKKSSSLFHNKNRTYSIDHTSNKERRESSMLIHANTNFQGGTSKQQIIFTFATMCFRLQAEYIQNCEKGEYDKAYQNLVVLLNYAVDISNMSYFFKVIHTMCQFFEILQQHEVTLKLYNQLKEAALLLKNYEYLILSLIGISKCAALANMFRQSIVIIKKALEYAWYVNNSELQLNIYDELGEKYYKHGDLDRANIYHTKYVNAVLQEQDSPLRTLSKKQIQIVQNSNLSQIYQNVSQTFLSHLSLPIKSTDQLSSLIPSLFTARQNMPTPIHKPVHEIGFCDGMNYQISRILNHWMFESESEEPNLQNAKNTQSKRSSAYNTRKFAFIDFKMNQHLKRKGIKLIPKSESFITEKSEQKRQEVRKKQSLDQKIKRMLEEPTLQKQWYENMVKRVQYDQKRKLTHISDPVRLTRSQNKSKQKQQLLKNLFKQQFHTN